MDLSEEYAAMSLRDEEEIEFSIDDGDDTDNQVDTPYILVGRLLTEKSTRFNFLKDTLASIWRPKKGMVAREVSTNLFLFYFVHEVDLKKVIDNGPWSYEQSLLLLKQIAPNVSPHSVHLSHADFWVQAYNIPPSMQTKKTAEMIGAFLGSFKRADDDNLDGLWKTFMRIRVQLDVSKPLKRKMKIKPSTGDTFYIEFKYERLTTFCFICGLIGHNETNCDNLFEPGMGSMERNYSPELRAVGRRAQPSAGQRWLLAELPRKSKEEHQLHTFASSDNSEHTNIPYKEIPSQTAQPVSNPPVS